MDSELVIFDDASEYLATCEVINWQAEPILQLADKLRTSSVELTAKQCFEWVRDNIRHSWDYQDSALTCDARQVLTQGTGYCYAKAHLLVALLRANGIPAGLCYQRLSVTGDGAPYCLHGLVAVKLPDYGWYRIDPRGNKPGVNAQFIPPVEQLAFTTEDALERDFLTVHAKPLEVVVEALTSEMSAIDLYYCLPDTESCDLATV